jgi:hypothetical protein
MAKTTIATCLSNGKHTTILIKKGTETIGAFFYGGNFKEKKLKLLTQIKKK